MIQSTITLNGSIEELAGVMQQFTAVKQDIASDNVDEWNPDESESGWTPSEPEEPVSVAKFERPSPLSLSAPITVRDGVRVQRETDAQYFEDDGYMSSHKFRDFAKCPYEYRFFPRPETKNVAIDLGSMIHKYVLEGEAAFEKSYIPWNPPTNKTTGKPYGKETQTYQKTWEEAAIPADALLYTSDDLYTVKEVVASIKRHPLVSQYFGDPSEVTTEFVVRVSNTMTKLKSKIDMYHNRFGLIDFKTTMEDLDRFKWKARDYGYLEQVAFYHWMLTDFVDLAYCPASIVVAESVPPYRVALFKIGPKTLEGYRDTVQKWVRDYDTCLNSDVWPTLYEDEKELK